MDGVDFFSNVPEGCILHILPLTSPRNACRSFSVSSAIQSVSNSDGLWEKFLPSDCTEIVSRSVSRVTFSSKKELYFRLCDDPIIIDEGRKSFGLDKGSGKKCYMLASRELSIELGDYPSYSRWISLPDSRFSEVAELLNGSWLEIRGKIKCCLLSPKTNYVAYIVFRFSTDRYQGLEFTPIEVSVRVGGFVSERTVYLKGGMRHGRVRQRPRRIGSMLNFREIETDGHGVPADRSDGWKEIEMGEFFNGDGDDGGGGDEFEGMQVNNWTGGIIIEGIEVRPKI